VLSPYRVIDLTGESGLLCGQILADLGADVIQVEPPGGSSARRVGPWHGSEPGLERSLYWWAYARNKRSIVLDVEREADRGELLRLLRGADFFVESERPGRLAELALGYEDLAAQNPSLIHVSITPFGSSGPKAGWHATDLTQAAAGGTAYLSGDGDSRPLRVRVPQSHAHAATDAAVGALIAHFQRKRTGRGQHVDVSQQQSMTLATMFRILDVPLNEAPARRLSGGVLVKGVFVPLRYPLKDGWVVMGPAMLPSTGHFMDRLVEWALEEGKWDPRYRDENWGGYAGRLFSGELGQADMDPISEMLAGFFADKTKHELMKAVVERRLLMAPVLALDEIIDGEQLEARGFHVAVEQPGVDGPVRHPGPFAKLSETPIEYRLPPPALDQHGAEIRTEPDRTPAAAQPTKPANGGATGLPLEGVKVLDLFWILAGPGATRMLADYGATVLHVESMQHLDTLRVIPPYQFSNPHPEGAGGFQSANANKLGMTLNVRKPEGIEILHELVRWADVVTESFAPGVVESVGLAWDDLRKIKPDLIMISSCLMGQSGPWRDFTGFGNLAASVTGFQALASWPDQPPSGPYGAYTDFISVRYNALAILAALEHRERTGQGQYIDQSQAEAALHFLAPAFLDYTVNGVVAGPGGNVDTEHSPHDVYPAAGDDRWVAIAIPLEEEAPWRALCKLMDCPELAARREDREVVDEAIAAWTQEREAGEIAEALQARGIAAHETLDTPGLHACPQIQHRGHYVETAHEIYQTTTIESSRLKLSDARARVPESALSFGRDNRYVLETLLGYPPERIAELAEKGVLI
jgi:crotonobetainyl-CoA:carnitine CoA-transferase CaiB-like acyl-CoA transferase